MLGSTIARLPSDFAGDPFSRLMRWMQSHACSQLETLYASAFLELLGRSLKRITLQRWGRVWMPHLRSFLSRGAYCQRDLQIQLS